MDTFLAEVEVQNDTDMRESFSVTVPPQNQGRLFTPHLSLNSSVFIVHNQ